MISDRRAHPAFDLLKIVHRKVFWAGLSVNLPQIGYAMKKKTSVSIYRKILAKLKALAKEQDRSVSYVLEKFMEAMVIEAPGKRKELAGRSAAFKSCHARGRQNARSPSAAVDPVGAPKRVSTPVSAQEWAFA